MTQGDRSVLGIRSALIHHLNSNTGVFSSFLAFLRSFHRSIFYNRCFDWIPGNGRRQENADRLPKLSARDTHSLRPGRRIRCPWHRGSEFLYGKLDRKT
jgi:hypothetical protein